MDFRLLGPVEARAAGRLIDLGYPKQRAVLAALILEHNQVVPTERLIDRVWGAAPPASVRNVLYGYIARLRAALTRTGEPGTAIARRPGGYLLGIELDQVDLFRFRRQVAEAESTSDQEVAAELLRGALALWRGPALAGLSGPWFSGLRETLEQQRLGALLDLGDIGLAQGRRNALIGDLTKEAVAYPADERLIGQLMLALYRSGRQSEALQWFERTRRRLAEDFGADPGPGLQSLHQRILRADRSLIPPARARVREWGGPRELPADVPAFVGRTAELSELDRLLATAVSAPRDRPATGQAGNGVPIYAISGTAGVGKTALAVRWAHQVRGHFPDGQLYVDLRGYGIEQPTPAADALAAFLRSLGVAGADIPARFEEQAARYRTLLNGKRLLIILDNAATAEQVRSLLPRTSSCLVVVTSRDSLAGLVARDGCQRLELDCFAEEEALELLRRLVGDRAEAELEVAAVLARQCGRLPLALRLVAELAAARPGELLADLAAELAHDQQRLDLLDAGGDPQTNVRAVFSWSFRRLPDSCARAFRLLGRHASHHGVDAQAAAAMTGTTVSEARRILRTLAREHLVHRVGPGRYAMNDLLRAYATDMTRHGSAPRSGGLSVAVDRSGRGGRASCLRIRLGRGPIARPLNGRPGHNSRYPGTCGRVYSLR